MGRHYNMIDPRRAMPVRGEQLSSLPRTGNGLPPCFSTLTSLRLGDNLKDSNPLLDILRPVFGQLIVAASGTLKTLWLDLPDISHDPKMQLRSAGVDLDLGFIATTLASASCNLAHLTCHGGHFQTLHYLLRLLISQRQSLTHLRFERTVMLERRNQMRTPAALCIWLADHMPRLTSFELLEVNTWYGFVPENGERRENEVRIVTETPEEMDVELWQLTGSGHWDHDEYADGYLGITR